jgi:hypothetical protein
MSPHNCVPSRIELRWRDLLQEVPTLREPHDLFLHVVATFSVAVNHQVIYEEELFSVVEFAIISQTWSSEVSLTQEDFVYTSMEAEEEGLVWFRKQADGWRVGSIFQQRECTLALDLGEIQSSLDEYYASLRGAIKKQFALDIKDLFVWRGKRTSPGDSD